MAVLIFVQSTIKPCKAQFVKVQTQQGSLAALLMTDTL